MKPKKFRGVEHREGGGTRWEGEAAGSDPAGLSNQDKVLTIIFVMEHKKGGAVVVCGGGRN